MTKITMPKFGWTMTEGKIVRWLKKEGDMVEKGEPLFEIETEKMETEVEAVASGILRKILAPEGSVVEVAKPIAILCDPGEELPPLEEILEGAPAPEAAPKAEAVAAPAERPAKPVRASPLAKKIASEHGIDLSQLEGTGPGGLIVKEDVLKAIEAKEAAAKPIVVEKPVEAVKPVEAKPPEAPAIPELPKAGKVIPLEGMRKAIADRLSLSARTAVRVTLTAEVDMTEAVRFRDQLMEEVERRSKVRLSFTHMAIKAAAKALERHPIINSLLIGDEIRLMEEINVGFAVALEEGLMVPVVRNANKKSLFEIASEVNGLAERARRRELSPSDVADGTFTITNLGMYGVDGFTPVINPPQTAILGIGRVAQRPSVVNGRIEPRWIAILSLAFDHRAYDGVPAAQFLQTLREILERPYELLV
ncbi:MAG: dihydrolipoamide acetyltransferase family protein [Candidatus Bathyarchaeia archaeon]